MKNLLTKGSLFGLLTGLLLTGSVFAQTPADYEALKQELEDARAQIELLRMEMDAIKTIPQVAQVIQREIAFEQPMDLTVDVSDAPTKGDKAAKVTLVEFADYQCPACASFATRIIPEVEKTYITSGQVKLVYYDFPLTQHPLAPKAAEAATCAGEQDKYWEMHDQLFTTQQLEEAYLYAHAETLGLDPILFKECLESGRHTAGVQEDMNLGRQVGLTHTPFFVIGYTENEGNAVRMVKRVRGSELEQAITEMLASVEAGE